MRKPIWQARWYAWIAYQAVILAPIPNRSRAYIWLHEKLLPYAGRWQYRNDHLVGVNKMIDTEKDKVAFPTYPGTETPQE